MKIEWNKVTWYSKLAAVILFVAVLFLGIYLGIKLGEIRGEAGCVMPRAIRR
jgi:hypothetical protein